MTDLTRRRLLSGAAVGAASLAGCLGGNGGDSDPTTDGSATPTETSDEGSRLRYIDILNRDDEAHTIHVQVERAGEVVYWGVHDLAAAGEGEAAGAMVEEQWDSGGPYTIEARVDDGPVRSGTYATGTGECVAVLAQIDGGRLSFYRDEGACGTTTAQ
ncbi:MAG: hypothetical protein ABEJ68_11545 [Halobacteriaceae archaeon]